MATASNLSGFSDSVIDEMHLWLFEEAMSVLNLPSAKPADLADVLAWILRPARLYQNGRLIYDGMKVPFSWQLACKAVGVDPDAYRALLVQEGKISQEFITMAQYIAEWKVIQKRDDKSERMLDKLLGPNSQLSSDEKYEVFQHLASYSQFDMFAEFDIPEVLPQPTVKRIGNKRLAYKPIETHSLF